jgi:hypothetical protein
MEISKIKTKYRQKGLDSFKTRLDLILIDKILKGTVEISVSRSDLKSFMFTNELILKYTTQYYQLGYKVKVDGIEIRVIWDIFSTWKKTHLDLIKTLQEYYMTEMFEKEIFLFEEFRTLFDDSQHRKCHYCGITEDMVRQLIQKQKLFKKRERGFILEIDRKRPNEEYTMDNSVLCCYWCNNAKTDEFCATEFKAIGEEIGKIWQKRLSK